MGEDKTLIELKKNPKNPRQISKTDFESLKRSIKEFGDLSGVVSNRRTGQLVGGHQRIEAFKALGANANIEIIQRLPEPSKLGTVTLGFVLLNGERYAYREVDWDPTFELAANIAANRIQGQFDNDLLAEVNYLIQQADASLLELTGQRQDEIDSLLKSIGVGGDEDQPSNLADTFIVPPFSILDTKQGYWQNRKRAWLDIGLKSEIGRDDALTYASPNSTDDVSKKLLAISDGTSVFDPVLCEIMYQWFNTGNKLVLDPFAGGSVRGVIASRIGHRYMGIELRNEQVEANRVQAQQLCADPLPTWITGDSNVVLDTITEKVDLVFSCPPYADLEVYSDDPNDLSNMPYPKFLELYRSIIKKSCDKLNDDRFAVWVVGEVRGKDGNYYNLIGDTITAFKDAGLNYYNEIILANAISTMPLRAGRQFNISRKIGKVHQNVLVFYKGDTRTIKDGFPELDFSTLDDSDQKDMPIG